MNRTSNAENVIMTTCHDHCCSVCLLKLHVRNGIITKVETDDGPEPQNRACARGRAYRQYVYHPDRLMYPLRRTGRRGEGKFERISWDEAMDTVASEIKRVKDTYGAASNILLCSCGDVGWLHNGGLIDRVLVHAGGYTGVLGNVSCEATWYASMAHYGTDNLVTGNTRDSLLKSKLIILWGWNPVVTKGYGNTHYYLSLVKKANIRVIAVDPRYTPTAQLLADQWIPIRPGTDTALLIAMAYVIITENLEDQGFLDKYTIGFNKFKTYVLGKEDGLPKTPAWAENIAGVPPDTTVNLARLYATSKPAALMDGWSVGRTAYGEQFHRAAATLSAMTGNVGIPGGSAGVGATSEVNPILDMGGYVSARMSGGDNPVHRAAPLRKDSLWAGVFYKKKMAGGDIGSQLFYSGGPTTAYLNRVCVADAILKGRAGGYPADYKLLYMVTINWLNQYANTNKIKEALRKLEFVVAQEQFMTPTAKFADIVFPTNTIVERNDVTWGALEPFYGYMNKAIASLGESKSQFEIAAGLAAKMGFSDFSDKTEEEWLRQIIAGCKDIPNYDAFKRAGIHRLVDSKPYVAFEEQIQGGKPFPTPSGKIEIYSQTLADLAEPGLPPIPKYIETWESIKDPLAKKYPLQLISTHSWRRTHSKFDNIPWLRELEVQAVVINPADALARGIKDGDMVRVFNDRGRMIIAARVTERIMPGVVEISEGAKYDPDVNGIDQGGCPNVLTKDIPSPGGGFCGNTALVQVEKAQRGHK